MYTTEIIELKKPNILKSEDVNCMAIKLQDRWILLAVIVQKWSNVFTKYTRFSVRLFHTLKTIG